LATEIRKYFMIFSSE